LALLKSETFPGSSKAPVMLNWKERTATPVGGVSVTVKLTGAVFPDGEVGVVGVNVNWAAHPAMNKRPVVVNRTRVALRIVASSGRPRLGSPRIYSRRVDT
jgi:hypothetical protein